MARVSAVVAPLAVLAMVLVAMLCASSVPTATAMESRFRKKFDVDKLSEVRTPVAVFGAPTCTGASELARGGVPAWRDLDLTTPHSARATAATQSWGEDDEEDEDWHEDNFEWREKEEEKRKAQVQFDPSDPSTFQNFQASQAATGMQVRPGVRRALLVLALVELTVG